MLNPDTGQPGPHYRETVPSAKTASGLVSITTIHILKGERLDPPNMDPTFEGYEGEFASNGAPWVTPIYGPLTVSLGQDPIVGEGSKKVYILKIEDLCDCDMCAAEMDAFGRFLFNTERGMLDCAISAISDYLNAKESGTPASELAAMEVKLNDHLREHADALPFTAKPMRYEGWLAALAKGLRFKSASGDLAKLRATDFQNPELN